jgi:hypothetical protein
MNQKFFIEGRLPGLNEIIAAAKSFGDKRRKWNAYAAMKAEHGKTIGWYIKAAKLRPVQRASFHFTWYLPDSRRDPDNIAAAKKFILDALVDQKIIPTDSQKAVIGFSDTFKKVSLKFPEGVQVFIEDFSHPSLF